MEKPINYGKILSSFVGRPYKLGALQQCKHMRQEVDTSETGDYVDCVSLIHEYIYKIRGIILDLDHMYMGEDLSLYADMYDKDSCAAMMKFKLVLDYIFPAKVPSEHAMGDIVFFESASIAASTSQAVGINAGNGMLLLVTEESGVITSPMYAYKILRSYLCQPRSQ